MTPGPGVPRSGADGDETIAAVATATGRGGIGVIRLSGPDARAIASLVAGPLPPPRHAGLRHFRDADGQDIDQGLLLWFPGPASYTGEDQVEFQGHGGPAVLRALLQRCMELGARPARPGEFTERAYLNGRLDLAQAEAVADLIEAGSRSAARAALRSLRGEFSRRVEALIEALTRLRVEVEASLDFPDESLELDAWLSLGRRAQDLNGPLETLLGEARRGLALREGLHVVIAGAPNVGKSSLLNCLAGSDRAIVTAIPGTTRDVLRESVDVDGLPVEVLDTAGLRDTRDPVEAEGVRRAWCEIEAADLLLLVLDDHRECVPDAALLGRLPARLPRLWVLNKCDLSGRQPGPTTAPPGGEDDPAVAISAREGWGLPALRAALWNSAGLRPGEEPAFLARERHVGALRRARAHLLAADERLAQQAPELFAEELRLAQETLGEISGAVSSDQLLGRIFSSFCIGK